LRGLQPPEYAKLEFSRLCWGPNFGDETPGFWNVLISQVLNFQAVAKIARSKMGRVLVETCDKRVSKLTLQFQFSKNIGLSGGVYFNQLRWPNLGEIFGRVEEPLSPNALAWGSSVAEHGKH
jgi:hypothetical protein